MAMTDPTPVDAANGGYDLVPTGSDVLIEGRGIHRPASGAEVFLVAALGVAEFKLAAVESVAKARAISDRASGRDPRFALDVLAILEREVPDA